MENCLCAIWQDTGWDVFSLNGCAQTNCAFRGQKSVSLVISAALFLIFAPSVIVQRVMAKKRADIRRISRERAYLEEKKFHLALERRRRKNADESEQDPEHTAD